MFGALKHGFRSLATLKLVVNVVGEHYTFIKISQLTEILFPHLRYLGPYRTFRSHCYRITVKIITVAVITTDFFSDFFTVPVFNAPMQDSLNYYNRYDSKNDDNGYQFEKNDMKIINNHLCS